VGGAELAQACGVPARAGCGRRTAGRRTVRSGRSRRRRRCCSRHCAALRKLSRGGLAGRGECCTLSSGFFLCPLVARRCVRRQPHACSVTRPRAGRSGDHPCQEQAVRQPPRKRACAGAQSEGAGAGPQAARPPLHERDLYLAWSCKRSRAVCGARAVVGVVGRSHLRGTAYHLLQARLRPCSQRLKGSNRVEGLCCSPFPTQS